MTQPRFQGLEPETQANISAFLEKPDTALIAPILLDLVRFYIPPDSSLPDNAPPEEIFALASTDSLTFLEIILDIQDAFEITIQDAEFNQLTSLPEIETLIFSKIQKIS